MPRAPKPKGAVLVIHENRGLTDHIRTIPPRFAADGYSALAVDLLSEEGGTATLGGDAAGRSARSAPRHLSGWSPTCVPGIDELQRRVPEPEDRRDRVLLRRRHDVAAARSGRAAAARPRRPSTGPRPPTPTSPAPKAAVLGGLRASSTRASTARGDAAVAALAGRRSDLRGQGRTPDANHAFFNDTGASYNAAAATRGVRGRARLVRPLPRVARVPRARDYACASPGGRDTVISTASFWVNVPCSPSARTLKI